MTTPELVTSPELDELWLAVTSTTLLLPVTVVLTMLCEPIDWMVMLSGRRVPRRAALTWAAALPLRTWMLAESFPPDNTPEPAVPHMKLALESPEMAPPG